MRLMAALGGVVLLAVACGGSADERTPPGYATVQSASVPPSEFERFLREFDQELATGSAAAIVSRLAPTPYTCTADDIPQKLGGPLCTSVGQSFNGFRWGRWRSEGSLLLVEQAVSTLEALARDVERQRTDVYGEAQLRVYGFDEGRKSAVVTAIIGCPPGFACVDSGQGLRVALVLNFAQGDGWAIPSLTSAYVMAEDFLKPTPEGREVMPGWRRFQP
jgi:hypothetical protein